MSTTLIILGASARAAAFSARRAGLSPYCGDYFADVDLQRCCPVTAITDYPNQLEDVARQSPPGPWMYTGALENYPELITRISAHRPLYGNTPQSLAMVRDPFRMADILDRSGLAYPKLSETADGLPQDGTWMLKARRSGGGAKVAAWEGKFSDKLAPEDCYFQQRVGGIPCSGVYVAAQGRSVLLGISQQIIGAAWTGGKDFHYSGSVGPWRLAPLIRDQFVRMGDSLAAECELAGIFGIDAMLDGSTVWPIEANPRFPASVEVLEHALEFSAVGLHVAACRDGQTPVAAPRPRDGWTGKAIVWARHRTLITDEFVRWADLQNAAAAWPVVADIPQPNSIVAQGSPIATVVAAGDDERDVWERLQSLTATLYQQCEPPQDSPTR